MPDGFSTITLHVPPEALARLKVAERRQRTLTKQRGLLAVPVSVEGLLLLQTQGDKIMCGCGCNLPLDFEAKYDPKTPPEGYAVIAHRLARGSKGEHTPRNVSIDRDACNKRDAGPDTAGAASVKRFTPDMQRKLLAPSEDRRESGSRIKGRSEIASRPFDKTKTRGFNGKVRDRV